MKETAARSCRYEFALYGRSGSGKTCVLGTMALGAEGHPGGFTCTHLPVTVPEPTGDRAGWTSEERVAAGLHEGKRWLEEARESLSKGSCPRPNIARGFEIPVIADFQIGCPDRGTFVVRMIDYSGESITPEGLDDPESFAFQLKQLLQHSDGFLLLADTPRSSAPSEDACESLRLLRQAFASLHEDGAAPIATPVAVCLTKWDRFESRDGDIVPEEACQRLRAYLDTRPAHQSLVLAIRNAVADQPDGAGETVGGAAGLAFGRTAVFPSSAFGRARSEGAADLPVPGGHSYGILDPLVWLANRRDSLDVARLEEDFACGGALRDGLLWRFGRYRPIGRRSSTLLERLPRSSAVGERVRHIGRGARRRLWGSVIAWILVLGFSMVASLDGGWTWWRRSEFDRHRAVAENPSSSDEDLLVEREWFTEYPHGWNGLFAPAGAEAQSVVDGIDDRRESLLWGAVEEAMKASDHGGALFAAKEYLTSLPHGDHADDATRIVSEQRAIEYREENGEWLRTNGGRWESLKDSMDTMKLEAFGQDLAQGLPHPEAATPAEREKAAELARFAAERVAEVQRAESFGDLVSEFENAMQRDDFRLAGQILGKYPVRSQDWQGLVVPFPKQLFAQAKKIADEQCRDDAFNAGRDVAQSARDALRELETTLRPTLPKLADGLLEGQRQVHAIIADIDAAEDRYLYARVLSHPEKETCRDYLQRGPLKTMQSAVTRYMDYLENLGAKGNWEIQVRLYWDSRYSSGDPEHVLTVSVDEKEELREERIADTPGHVSGVVGKIPLYGVALDDSIRIAATLIEDDYWQFLNDDAGSGKATFKLKELLQEKAVKLRPKDGQPFENELRIQIANSPQAPPLPEWKDQ